jgi:hypothetical protein
MSRPRKPFGELSEGHQRRLLRYYEREHGWSRRQVAGRYDRGTLPDLKSARGHEVTAEHGGGRTGGKSMPVLVRDVGRVVVEHLHRRERLLVGAHWRWLINYRDTGEERVWIKTRQRWFDADDFEGKTVGAEKYELEASLDAIEHWALIGETDIGDDLYEDLEAA